MSVVKKRTLLHDEPSIVIQPEMVRRLGNLTDAAVLQQLNYWMPHAKVKYEGRMWVFKTYENWSKEIGISDQQVRRAMERLESMNIVVSCTPRGRTKHYAVNYDHPMLDGASSPDTYQADSPDDQADSPDDQASSPTYKDLHKTKEEKHLAASVGTQQDGLWVARCHMVGLPRIVRTPALTAQPARHRRSTHLGRSLPVVATIRA